MGDNDHQCDKGESIAQLLAGEGFMKQALAELKDGQAKTQDLLVRMGETLVGMAHTQEAVKRLFEVVERLEKRVLVIEKKPGEKALKIQNMIETWVIRAFVAGGLVYFFADKI
jgi:chaperonin cofactor prefoldin